MASNLPSRHTYRYRIIDSLRRLRAKYMPGASAQQAHGMSPHDVYKLLEMRRDHAKLRRQDLGLTYAVIVKDKSLGHLRPSNLGLKPTHSCSAKLFDSRDRLSPHLDQALVSLVERLTQSPIVQRDKSAKILESALMAMISAMLGLGFDENLRQILRTVMIRHGYALSNYSQVRQYVGCRLNLPMHKLVRLASDDDNMDFGPDFP